MVAESYLHLYVNILNLHILCYNFELHFHAHHRPQLLIEKRWDGDRKIDNNI